MFEPFNKYRMSVSRDYSCCQGSSVVFYSLPIVLEKRHLFQIRNFVNSIVVNSLVCPPVFIQQFSLVPQPLNFRVCENKASLSAVRSLN